MVPEGPCPGRFKLAIPSGPLDPLYLREIGTHTTHPETAGYTTGFYTRTASTLTPAAVASAGEWPRGWCISTAMAGF